MQFKMRLRTRNSRSSSSSMKCSKVTSRPQSFSPLSISGHFWSMPSRQTLIWLVNLMTPFSLISTRLWLMSTGSTLSAFPLSNSSNLWSVGLWHTVASPLLELVIKSMRIKHKMTLQPASFLVHRSRIWFCYSVKTTIAALALSTRWLSGVWLSQIRVVLHPESDSKAAAATVSKLQLHSSGSLALWHSLALCFSPIANHVALTKLP